MLAWTDWPARRRPLRSLFAVAVVVAATGVAASVEPILGFVAAFLLLSAVRDALFPTRFSLDEHGVRLHNPLRRLDRDWARFAGWRRERDGFQLRGRTSSPLLQRRGAVFLPCVGHEPDVEALLTARIGPPEPV